MARHASAGGACAITTGETMMAATLEPRPWPNRRWWMLLVIVLGLQVGSIFWLSDKKPAVPRSPAVAPVLHLLEGGNPELLELRNPTLFALPHARGFSGIAWRKELQPELPSLDRSEIPEWLPLKADLLGATMGQLTETNLLSARQAPSLPNPELLMPQVIASQEETRSRLSIEGEPPLPRLEIPITLPSWPARQTSATDTELLTNTVVQLLINTEGKPVSATLLSGSGSKPADDYALAQARAARFSVEQPAVDETKSLGPILAGLRWCQFVFEWHTLPATNSPLPNP